MSRTSFPLSLSLFRMFTIPANDKEYRKTYIISVLNKDFVQFNFRFLYYSIGYVMA